MSAASDQLGVRAGFFRFYEAEGPADNTLIPWTVESLKLHSASELLDAQVGYRWIGEERVQSPSWLPTWVVVASVFNDPFFVDTSVETGPVLFARHGAGGWEPHEVASSMESFVQCLARFESVLLGRFDLDVWNDSGLRPDFVAEVKRAVGGVLTAEQVDAFIALIE